MSPCFMKSLTIKLCLCVWVVGTYLYTPPEGFLEGHYKAEPTAVWQLGVVLFQVFHKRLPFRNRLDIIHENILIHLSSKLSSGKS